MCPPEPNLHTGNPPSQCLKGDVQHLGRGGQKQHRFFLFGLLSLRTGLPVHKNIATPLFLNFFYNLHTILTRIFSQFFIFYSKSKFDHCGSMGIIFKELAPVRSIFVGFRRFTPHFDENWFMNQNQTIVAKMALILVNFIMCMK